jgi:hypothetical protein
MIQYSCSTAMPLLRTLLKHGAQVTLYVQDDATALHLGSQEQAERISHVLKALRGELGGLYDPGSLDVRTYRSPGSVSAVKIDREWRSPAARRRVSPRAVRRVWA